MLVRLSPLRKDSFSASLNQAGNAWRFPHTGQVRGARPREKREGDGPGQPRITQEGAAQGWPEAPARVGRDGFEAGRGRLGPSRDLDQVHFSRKAIVEDGLKNPDFRIESQEQKNPPAGGSGEVNSLGESHFRKPASQVPIRRAPHLRVDTGVRRETGEVPPVESAYQGERFSAGCSRMPCQSTPDRVVLASAAIRQERCQQVRRDVRPVQDLEVVRLEAHRQESRVEG